MWNRGFFINPGVEVEFDQHQQEDGYSGLCKGMIRMWFGTKGLPK